MPIRTMFARMLCVGTALLVGYSDVSAQTRADERSSLRESTASSGRSDESALKSAEIAITSHDDRDTIARSGETIFGTVTGPKAYSKVQVTFLERGKKETVDVGDRRGQFAFRIFPRHIKLSGGETVSVSIQAFDPVNGRRSEPVTLRLMVDRKPSGIAPAVNRLSFGGRPGLISEVRDQGFEAYVRRQLEPEKIADRDFLRMGFKHEINLKDIVDAQIRIDDDITRMTIHSSINSQNLAHALYSERQLNEVMTRFWANHFHTILKFTSDAGSDVHEWNGFRRLALSSFHQLLLFSAQSPAMLRYLDNSSNSAKDGINENYARELLELHTVGIDSGYGDADVAAVAKIFTGWRIDMKQTISHRSAAGETTTLDEYKFRFNSYHHIKGDKTVPFLGEQGRIEGRRGDAGIEEGRELLRILANHSQTRKFVCGKLVAMLVSDTAKLRGFNKICNTAWKKGGGQIKPILKAILLDSNYAKRALSARNKIRTGLEYSLAIARAFDITPRPGQADRVTSTFYNIAARGGYPFKSFPTPDGLPENGDVYLNAGSMVSRFNAVQGLLNGDFTKTMAHVGIYDEIKREELETAEEVAAYLLAIPTANIYTIPEFKAVQRILRGDDGVFTVDDTKAIRKALGLITILPSLQLQ